MGNFEDTWILRLIGSSSYVVTGITPGFAQTSQYGCWQFQQSNIHFIVLDKLQQNCEVLKLYESVLCTALKTWHFHGVKTSSESVQSISGTGGTIPAPSFLHLVDQGRSPNKERKRGQTWPYPFQIEPSVPSGGVVCVYVQGNVPQFCSESIHWLHLAQN